MTKIVDISMFIACKNLHNRLNFDPAVDKPRKNRGLVDKP